MWSGWSVDEGLIYAIVAERFPTTAGAAYATMGLQSTVQVSFNSQYPARIYEARFVTATGGAISASGIANGGSGYANGDTGVILNSSGTQATYSVTSVSAGAVTGVNITSAGTGYSFGSVQPTQATTGTGVGLTLNLQVTSGGQNRNKLDVVNSARFYSHRDLMAQAQTPDELYPDFAIDTTAGFIRLYMYPIPNINGALELDMAVNFTSWTLTGNYAVPPGYSDAINYALAFRLLMPFGVKDQAIIQLVTAEAQKSELRIRKMNAVNRQLPPGAEMLEQPQAQPVKA